MNNRGVLIVVEGVDRVGKTTQCNLLTDCLQKQFKQNVVYMKFPDRLTPTGKIIDEYLQSKADVEDHVIHLLFSANRWEAAAKIRHLLSSGTSIIMDRYAFSGIAYSHAKGFSLDWCKAPDRGLPAPDVVIYLAISIDTQITRGDWGGERYEKKVFQGKVRDAFKLLYDHTWIEVDGDRREVDVHATMREIAIKIIDRCHNTPLPILWEEAVSQ